jgi:hypothetical protein
LTLAQVITPLWRRIRARLFNRFFVTLGLMLGVMQVVVGHWITVVLAGRPGPGLALGLVLAAALVAANAFAIPVLRSARRERGWGGAVAQAYFAVGLGTLLLGSLIVLTWAGFLPLAGLLTALGASGETLFQAFRVATIPVVGALALLLVWGFTGGQRQVQQTHVRVPLEGLHEDLRGLRIVQLSDLHIGNGMEGPWLARMVDAANALEPDLIAITGDIFDFDPRYVEEGAKGLAGLRARYGVFAVLGNHDTYTGVDVVVEGLGRCAPNIRLLRGELARVPVDAPLYVAGVDDPGRLAAWTEGEVSLPELQDLAEQRPDDGPVVLLVHRPQLFPQASRLGFELVLAGHTHGGQLALPGGLNLARFLTRFNSGLYHANRSTLYVNRGFGVAGPSIRVYCPREIATIELV